ncbi:cytochrome b5-like heme/steroid binding domain-containing protein [Radiomyces spectabilis]|uniref:cytochrome b5-like heme/steroid binding domain-containing protein n=1 Tax=Radiomyces spectabilis TaxID=64574 RepID=UPI002220E286|nr:cytochrome b5-like heme/steroid binding domain-containing protein [Radiomyces spectabilis]KAI8372948.1 cytochrome b5-like heme/steroid binding domain-containing protein [Radiomyces spectabilis]
MSAKLFSYEEVSKHSTRKDLWMIIDKKVYDITAFVDEHPGGEEVLLDEGAKDASGPFDDVGHSDDARDLLKKYYIGDVDTSSTPVVVSRQETQVLDNGPQGNPLRIIVPVLLLAGYIYYRFFMQN